MNRENMSEQDRMRLLLHLGGELQGEESKEIDRELAENGELSETYQRMNRMSGLLSDSVHDAFGPSFADRVIERIDREERGGSRQSTSFADAIIGLFARLGPVALIALITLGVYNISNAADDQSTLEAALGLRPVTTETAYDGALASFVDEE